MYAVNVGDLQDRSELEAAIVEEDSDGITRAYRSDTGQTFVEYWKALVKLFNNSV